MSNSIGALVAKWLEYIESNNEALDKMEMIYRDKLDSEVELNNVEDCLPETCCNSSCDCRVLHSCCQPNPMKEKERDSEKSILKEFTFSCGCTEVCFQFQGQKVGSSKRIFCDGSVMNRYYKKGFLYGFSRTIGKNGDLQSVGKWRGSTKVGTWWDRVEGDAWVISNSKIENKIFIYPDLTTVIIGQIESGSCISQSDLQVCELVGLNSDVGILAPILKQTNRMLPISSSE